MPALINRSEYVTIDSVALATPAYWIKDPTPLLDAAPVRGDDRLIPFSAGRLALPRIRDSFRVQLPIIVNGLYDNTGAASSSPRAGVKANLAIINALAAPSGSGDGTKAISYTFASGSPIAGYCFVIGPLQWQALNNRYDAYQGVLDILIPSGLLS